MKRKIHFYGELTKLIGEDTIEMDIDNLSQLRKGVEQYYPGFTKYINKHGIKMVIGDEENPIAVSHEEMMGMDLGTLKNIWITPNVVGDVAAAFLALPLFLQVVVVVGLVIYARNSYKAAQQNDKEPQEENPSYLFNGGFNRSEEAIGLPIVYGETRTGSVVISVGLESDDFSVTPS